MSQARLISTARKASSILGKAVDSSAQNVASMSRQPQPCHSSSLIPVIRSLPQLRRWRQAARLKNYSVGCVPTMGALHEGHLNLVRASLQKNPLTLLTLFVNPTQFAPTEDLSSYPRSLDRDLDLLRTLLPAYQRPYSTSRPQPLNTAAPASARNVRGLGVSENESFRSTATPSLHAENEQTQPARLVVFAPPEEVMYPLRGELQDLDRRKGVEVDVKGWGDVLEGGSRPQFFKGVATVCTKLFNAVEPDHAYFGQKDIQQALLLKIMLKDLLLNHPSSENLHIMPTTRDPNSNLALSSRNAYLSPSELAVAPALYNALQLVKSTHSTNPSATAEELLAAGRYSIESLPKKDGVDVRVDYLEIFERESFEVVRGVVGEGRELVVAGAIWVGGTRLIDNLLLGWQCD